MRYGESKIIVEHTGVKKECGGKDAKELMKKAATFARENKVKIVPVCWYVGVTFKEDKSIRDVLA